MVQNSLNEAAAAGQRNSLLRFDLAIQRSRVLVYTASVVAACAGQFLGVFRVKIIPGAINYIVALVLTAAFGEMFRRNVDRRTVNTLWILTDVVLTTIGVWVTGGIGSPWFIWYLAGASAVAFVVGKSAAYAVMLLDGACYLAALFLMGQAHWVNDVLLVALCQMVFLFGASTFFLAGIGNLQEKRLQIRRMEAEEKAKIVELTRLTEELNRRTEELAEANARIQEADRLKSQFLANMSHELRTPMNSIIGFSEILVERLEGQIEPKHTSFLKHILASGQHLLGIINDILDLSKIEAGKMEIFPEIFAVAPVIESVCHVMRGMTRTRPNFVLDVPADLPKLESDMAKFKQVLFNLLSNAVKFSPPDAPITISARHVGDDDGWIVVSVEDQGIGIEPRYHNAIFEEFRQVDGTVRREFGGTGLGLALVKKFVELQGGRVSVDSSPGTGSRFSFQLPIHARSAVASRLRDEETLTDAERVLVVEDDAGAYGLIAGALRSAGYVPLHARRGEEVLPIAREKHPVAITLDLVLPGMDGWEVLKALKGDGATRDIPVVVISMIDNRELGIALGADDYFVKPVDRQRLVERIGRIAGHTHRRLLLIDDDPSVHTLVGEELGHLGYAVESAYSGEEGVRVATAAPPDIVILDLMMPGMSGFEVATALKENPTTANVPIVILTSKEISSEDRRELQSKVLTFVQKGHSARDQLTREIRRLSARPAPTA